MTKIADIANNHKTVGWLHDNYSPGTAWFEVESEIGCNICVSDM